MKSAIAILTYNRIHALSEELQGLDKFCSQYPIAIFEDCGNKDGTAKWISGPEDGVVQRDRPDLMAVEYQRQNSKAPFSSFLGTRNLGVAGNSNRALKWFMDETDADHLILMNDDLHVLGDFVQFYAQAHTDLGVGMFCFCDFTSPSYRWADVKSRGYGVKLCPRMTGIMISTLRSVIKAIGYFDTSFGKFGEEHCDWTNRARFVGAISLNGMPQTQIDVHHHKTGEQPRALLKHQEVETSVTGADRKQADAVAAEAMRRAADKYRHRGIYGEFALMSPTYVGGTRNVGIPVDNISSTYPTVVDLDPVPLRK